MKSSGDPNRRAAGAAGAAAIVHLAGEMDSGAPGGGAAPAPDDAAARARAFAEPLLAGQVLDTGEPALGHAEGVARVLQQIGGAPSLEAAAYLVYAGDYLQRPEETIRKAFGPGYASLVALTRQLVQVQRAARAAQLPSEQQQAQQTERVRKMLLAFSRDLRVVLLRLASRLQTLRWFAEERRECPRPLAAESQQVFAPLANRLGIWQIKWELEDLAFRFLEPAEYQRIARLVDEKRTEREQRVEQARARLAALLARAGIAAEVAGRPKHLYSIWKKMQGKRLAFERVFDVRALRVVVGDVAACYAALARVHEAFAVVDGEFDDYIARPKPNGYQSLHTVVRGEDGRAIEVQIRTRAMHEHAEHGVAAHWMYKEAGVRGYAGVVAKGEFEERVAEARKAVLRELLAWERETQRGEAVRSDVAPTAVFDDRIYVFTPQATIIELPGGGTPVDFAYSLHTELGHRCRGARVDGQMVPLNTPLRSGQTVEIVSTKEGGPSLDWLNPELHYLQSARAKAKVRAWFNAEQLAATVARGREAVERLLQREGRTSLERDRLAAELGFADAAALFESVGKDEFSVRQIENHLRPAAPPPAEAPIALREPSPEPAGTKGGVLVVGMDSLLTTLARCCRPAPPDAISGYVTRGRGVAVHRAGCANLRQMVERDPGRLIEVAWGDGAGRGEGKGGYAIDVVVEAQDRAGLLRDVSEVFTKERLAILAANTTSSRERGSATLLFTVEAPSVPRLQAVLGQLRGVPGIRHARRR